MNYYKDLRILFFIFIIALMFSCSGKKSAETEKLTIGAAANLNYVMTELTEAYEKKEPKIELEVVFSSSGKLYTQIIHGAPFDLYLSANTKYPEKLFNEGFTKIKPVIYAKGAIVLFSLSHELAGINGPSGLIINLKEGETLAIANPKTAPYGKGAEEFLEFTKQIIPVESLLIGTNISQAFEFAVSAADYGIVPLSAVYGNKNNLPEGSNWIVIPPGFYEAIVQSGVVLSSSKNSKKASAFMKYLISPEAQEIFHEYGYR